jgi:tripartite-type tricarboxylate transporter receptor subunit TctC
MASSPSMDWSYLNKSLGAALVAAALAAPACAADKGAPNGYPSKPVRFISPFSAGGGTDTVARTLALRMGEQMGRVFVVDNRGGAEGVIGTDLGAKSPPDGYTLVVVNLGTMCIAPNLRKVPYDPLKDFAPISLTTESSTVLAVNPSLPVRNVKELVALAKSKPGQLNYGASSSATMLPMEMLSQMAGIKMNHVPYKGSAPTIIATISGEVQLFFGGAIVTVPQVKSGKLRALAVAGDKRARALPDIPTVAESGFPGYEANSWNGIAAPAGTPKAIVEKLNAAMVKVLQLPDVRETMIHDGAEPAYNTPEQFGTYIRNCNTKWARVIKMAGLKETQ